MPPKIDISLKKQAKQPRAIATVAAIVEAATYILASNGVADFTANKVAEKAGVNIASFYQYFPNKQALLFHIVTLTWEKQMARLHPILMSDTRSPAERLRAFIHEFFLVEAAEVDFRRALRAATIELRDTAEFKSLLSEGAALFRNFLEASLDRNALKGLDFFVEFSVILITSFAERTTDEGTFGPKLTQQADLLTDMLLSQMQLQ